MGCATERGDFPPLPAEWGQADPRPPDVLRANAIHNERDAGVVREYDVDDIDALLHTINAIDKATQVKILVALAEALKLFGALEILGLARP